MNRSVTTLLLATSILAGCTTHLEVLPAGNSVASRTGFAYPLQFTQYEVTLTRRVADCNDGGLPRAQIKAEVVTASVDDGEHVYVISPSSLVSPTKISDLQVAWEEGRLKSVNASAEDRTGQIAVVVVQGVAKLAAAQFIGGVGAGGGFKCNKATIDNVALAKQKDDEISDLGDRIASDRLGIAEVEARLAKEPKNPALAKRLTALSDDLEAAGKALAAAQKSLAKALEALTDVRTLRWPETSQKFESEPMDVGLATLRRWIETPPVDLNRPDQYDAQLAGIGERFRVVMRIERVGTYGVNPATGENADSAGAKAGLRYRLPAVGRLVICKEELCASTEKDKVVLASSGPVQQLGRIFYVPFSSPVFSNAQMNISFDKLGRPVAAGIKRPTAAAETAATAFRDIAGEAVGIADALYKTPQERLATQLALAKARNDLATAEAAGDTPLNQFKRETELAKAQADLAKAQRDLAANPADDLKRQTDLLIAQKTYNDAVRALDQDPNAATGDAAAGFRADTALLEAEKLKIEAEIARDAAIRKRDEGR